MNNQTNKKISSLYLSAQCQNILRSNYNIDKDIPLLQFKVDIKRKDTLGRQIEYQLYNPNPRKIIEKLNLSLCIPELNETQKERRLEESHDELNIGETLIYSPVDWEETHLKLILELYNKNINYCDPTEDFYNDVCFKYQTPEKSDIYIQSRREKYFLTLALCQENCTNFGFDNETNRTICKCPILSNINSPENVTFVKPDLNEFLKKNIGYQIFEW